MDLRDNTFHSFKVDDSLLKAFQSSKDWDELVKYYLDHHVFQESKADVARIYDRNYVIKKLDSKNRKLSVDSKVMLDGKPRWVRNTVTLSSVDGGGRPSHVVVLVRDISKEKEAEELKARYLKIMAALSMDYDSVFYVNLDENLLTVIQSSSAFDIIRKDMGVINYDENVKRLINNVVDEEDALDLLEFVKRDNLINLLKSKKDFSYRFRVCSNSQDDKVFELHFVDVSQKYGEHILVAGSRCIDAIIYEETKHRDELEEANRKAQLQLDTVTNAIPGGFKISKDDEKYSFKYISPKLAEMFGYSVKELYEVSNGNVEDWVKEEDREQAVRDVQTGYAVSDSYATKYRVKCKDNEWRWVSDHGRKVKQKDGSIEHYSFILDIDNEERQAEQIKEANAILKRERGQYREALLYECLYTFTFDLTVGYITEDYWLSTGENPIQFFNLKPPIHFDILVKELKKVISTDLNKEKEMDDLCVEGLLKNYQHGKKFYEFEYYANNMNSYQRMTILMTTNDENGHVTACVIGHDITEQKMQVLSARKALADANKELQIALFEAEKANSAKSQFLSRMSHDIRTPMNGILGMARIAKETIEDKGRVLVALNKIEKAGKQLEMLINDVLDMSRLESGRTELAHKVFDINELLASGGDDLEEMIKDKKLRLKGSHFNNTHHMLIGSPLHLRRITQNIISNAVKYNRENGSLEAWLDEIPVDNKHSIFCFKVTDTGIGMSQEYIEHLFEPFSRGVNDAGTTYQGTGLGMAIVKELVDLMGGKIEVESDLNVGTTFTLKIPFELYFGDIEKEEKEVEEDGNLEGMRFLVVEDNQLNMEIIQFILEEAGAVISMASDGKDAVEKFIHTPEGNYDVILMDIMMPVMDGLEATRRIRALEREDAKTIPIIAMTANAFTEDVFKSREAGMNDHLAKPIDVKLLMHTLKKYNKK